MRSRMKNQLTMLKRWLVLLARRIVLSCSVWLAFFSRCNALNAPLLSARPVAGAWNLALRLTSPWKDRKEHTVKKMDTCAPRWDRRGTTKHHGNSDRWGFFFTPSTHCNQCSLCMSRLKFGVDTWLKATPFAAA